ncbi:regulator of ribonuclease-like protein [Trifolium medium]|uniref:Regulator of ribonuclease-like protein n=1 Tax=Trifolium medium TaxID=97028 RepID=A0A392QNH7_9FABA|nr:regulator of ribonuclease-like protein [Trifolium medium]
MNPGNMHNNMQISACYDSQFRRSLMEYLDKPYDQEEYDRLKLDISKRHLKERHVETRQGVVKSYHSKGVSKSYLDWYPGRSRQSYCRVQGRA